MPTFTGFLSTCLNDTELACHIKRWYEIESYGAYKQVNSRSAEDKRAAKILDSSTVHDGSRYAVGMLWAEKSNMLPDNYYSALVQLKSLEKRLAKDPHLRNQNTKTIGDDLSKGYVIQVTPHNFSNRSIRDWCLPHHPVVNRNKPGKLRRVLNGASKFHGTSLNKSLLVGPDLLQTLCSFFSVFVNILLPYRLTLKGCSYKSASFQRTNLLFVFCGGRNPQPMWLYTSTPDKSLEREIRRHVQIRHCSGLQWIIRRCSLTQRPQF